MNAAQRVAIPVSAEIEFLRGVAALSVVLSHIGNNGLAFLPFLNFSGFGQFGVICFFFISGFVLTVLHKTTFTRDISLKDFARYYLRRVFRIFPLLWVVMIATFVLQVHYFNSFSFVELLDRLFLITSPPSVLWTLPVELKYYLILPLLIFVFWFLLNGAKYFLVIFFAVYLGYCFYYSGEADNVIIGLGIHRYTVVFVTGVFTGIYFETLQGAKFPRLSTAWFGVLLLVLALIVLLMNPEYYVFAKRLILGAASVPDGVKLDFETYWNKRYVSVAVISAAFLYCAVKSGENIRGFFAWKPFLYLGHVSYSIYLIHMPVLDLTIKLPLPGPAKGILVIVFTLIISHFTYKYVERPFIDLGRKLTAREGSLMAMARS